MQTESYGNQISNRTRKRPNQSYDLHIYFPELLIYQPTVPTCLSTVNLSIHLPIYPFLYLPTYPSIHKTIDIPTKLLIYQSMYISTYLSSSYQLYIFLPTNIAIHLTTYSIYPYIYPSNYLPISLPTHISIYTACRIIRQVDILVIFFFQEHFTNSKPYQS